MKTFTLELLDSTRSEEIAGVTSFVGEDSSGSFGILAGHDRLMTLLLAGLARFRIGDGPWSYLAMPGALLRFERNRLTLSTRRYLLDEDYTRIHKALHEQLLAEEHKLINMTQSLQRMEESVLRKLWEMGRQERT
jgi:F-type H+-transporting ATPase subunit epsilon